MCNTIATVRFAAELGYEVTVVKDATVAIQSCRNTNRETIDRP
jgi:nicotinamidase-related amidase